MPATSPVGLFDRFNTVSGAAVTAVTAATDPEDVTYGTCDQVRVFRAASPTDFFVAWWSPWPEGDPRSMHVIHVVRVEVLDDALMLFDYRGGAWLFRPATGQFADSVLAYRAHKAANAERYAELEAAAVQAAQDLWAGKD